MKRGFIVAVVALLAGALGAGRGAGPAPAEKRIYVGAWNIEHLGQPGNRSGAGKDVAQSPQDIADYIKASKVHVLALSEISYNEGTDEHRKNKTLEKACAALNEDDDGAQWKHRLFPKRDDDAKSQCLGVMWNERDVAPKPTDGAKPAPYHRLNMTAPANAADHPDYSPGRNYFDRWATGMKFSAGAGKTDVVLIPVHLKANVGGVAAARKQRNVEASMLVKALPSVRTKFADDDVIILGDTNVLRNDEATLDTLGDGGFDDLNALDVGTHQGGAPFDRVLLANDRGMSGKNKEFAASSQDVVAHPDFSAALFKKRLSDHYMVRTTFTIMDDDD